MFHTNKEILSNNDINSIQYEETITDSRGKKVAWISYSVVKVILYGD